MNATFLHTADWQLGKPFAGVDDEQKRILLQQERLNVLDRIGEAIRTHKAEFVLVAGDLFDSPSVTKYFVSAACSGIGRMGVPVLVIPGNHDHGGPGSVWEQKFFQDEARQLAPNLNLLLKAEPVELGNAVVLPCPLSRRHETSDPTSWLRTVAPDISKYGDKARIVLAHGSVQGFIAESPDEEVGGCGVPNLIDLSRLPEAELDYVALGDWHGTKQVGTKAWYAGTPELDRFVKGGDHDPGNVLVVKAKRGSLPEVTPVRTCRFTWNEFSFSFASDADLVQLEAAINNLTGSRAGQDLLWLELRGSIGIEATTRLEAMVETWRARLLRLKLANATVIAPSEAEIQALTQRVSDPLISRVATRLVHLASATAEDAAAAQLALRELHAATLQI
jgi:DNA repair exonuclease SbcCD nuclease subunit